MEIHEIKSQVKHLESAVDDYTSWADSHGDQVSSSDISDAESIIRHVKSLEEKAERMKRHMEDAKKEADKAE